MTCLPSDSMSCFRVPPELGSHLKTGIERAARAILIYVNILRNTMITVTMIV